MGICESKTASQAKPKPVIEPILSEPDNNYIIAEIYIKDEDINKEIQIINSYENDQRRSNREIIKEYMNEEEIKKCEIRINDKLIPFTYSYTFTNKGKYIIKYSFNNYLSKTNYMFSRCSSLTSLNLSNFNSQNVINMDWMFAGCSSLTSLNLSKFNTQNVTNMVWMFSGCTSLTNINLSTFNTQNVTNMNNMFSWCSSLTNINLSNFNTQNVTNMNAMFFKCSSLTNINLSNFNTQNVSDMSWMFRECSSLTSLNLSNFNTQKVTNMDLMFYKCSSLKEENIITGDNRIINQFQLDKF